MEKIPAIARGGESNLASLVIGLKIGLRYT